MVGAGQAAKVDSEESPPDPHGDALRLPRERRRKILAPLALIFLTAAAFANTLRNAFHLDDFYRVVENPGIQTVSPWWRHFVDVHTMATLPTITNYRPLLPLTISLNYALGRLNPVGYHLVNIALQAAAAVLAYFLFLSLLEGNEGLPAERRPWVSFAAAAIFAVHPVSGIPVNYVSGRDLLLMQVFMTGSLLAYVRMRGRGGGDSWAGWAAVLLLYCLGLLSKTGIVVVPALILGYELLLRRQSLFSPRVWLRVASFLALAAAFFAYVSLVLHHSEVDVVRSREYTPLVYAATQLKLHLFHYLRNFVWPFPIRQGPEVPASAPTDVAVLAGAGFVLATVAAAWLSRRRLPVVAFCVIAYWALFVPEGSIFPLWALATDYRSYASSPYLFLAVAAAAAAYVRPPRALALSAGLAVAWFLGATLYLNTTWRTERTLWSHSVRHGGSALAHMNLAMTYRDPGVRARHLREALRLAPNYILAHMNLGLALIDLGKPEEALDECLRAVAIEPGRAQTRYWMAKAYEKLGRPEDRAREAAEAARLEPSNVEYRYYAGQSAHAVGHWAEAIVQLGPIARRVPPYKDARSLYEGALSASAPDPPAAPVIRCNRRGG